MQNAVFEPRVVKKAVVETREEMDRVVEPGDDQVFEYHLKIPKTPPSVRDPYAISVSYSLNFEVKMKERTLPNQKPWWKFWVKKAVCPCKAEASNTSNG